MDREARRERIEAVAEAWRSGQTGEAFASVAEMLGAESPLRPAAEALAQAARASAQEGAADVRPLPMRVHEALIEAAARHDIAGDGEIEALLGSLREAVDHDPRLALLVPDLERADVPPDADRPIKVAFLGEFSTGKSSLINALLDGAVKLPEGMAPVTASLTEIRYAAAPEAEVVYADGQRERVAPDDLERHVDQRSTATGKRPQRLILGVPSAYLRTVTILDTPGFNANNFEHEQAAQQVITEADVVLWVFKATMAGRRSIVGHLAYVERALEKSIGVINYVDAVRPKLDRDPEGWSEKLDDIEAELQGLFETGFERWVRTSAKWIRAGRPEGGHEDLLATLMEIGTRRTVPFMRWQGKRRELARKELARRALLLEERAALKQAKAQRASAWSKAVAVEGQLWREALPVLRRRGGQPAPVDEDLELLALELLAGPVQPKDRACVIDCLTSLEHHAALLSRDDRRRWLGVIERLGASVSDGGASVARLWTEPEEQDAADSLEEFLRHAEGTPGLLEEQEPLVKVGGRQVTSVDAAGWSFARITARELAGRFPLSARSWDGPLSSATALREVADIAAEKKYALTHCWRTTLAALKAGRRPRDWSQLKHVHVLAEAMHKLQGDMVKAHAEYEVSAHRLMDAKRTAERASEQKRDSPLPGCAGVGFLLMLALAFFGSKKGALGAGVALFLLSLVIGGVMHAIYWVRGIGRRWSIDSDYRRAVAATPVRDEIWLSATYARLLAEATPAVEAFGQVTGVLLRPLPGNWSQIKPPVPPAVTEVARPKRVSDHVSIGASSTAETAEQSFRRCAGCTSIRGAHSDWCSTCFDLTPTHRLEAASKADLKRGWHERPGVLQTHVARSGPGEHRFGSGGRRESEIKRHCPVCGKDRPSWHQRCQTCGDARQRRSCPETTTLARPGAVATPAPPRAPTNPAGRPEKRIYRHCPICKANRPFWFKRCESCGDARPRHECPEGKGH